MLRRILLATAIAVAPAAPVALVGAAPAGAACAPFTGYVLHKSGNSIYVWNPNTGCEAWKYAGLAYTCDPYEWFNGYSCPTTGGGGGGGSW